jgi:hypothetical protein
MFHSCRNRPPSDENPQLAPRDRTRAPAPHTFAMHPIRVIAIQRTLRMRACAQNRVSRSRFERASLVVRRRLVGGADADEPTLQPFVIRSISISIDIDPGSSCAEMMSCLFSLGTAILMVPVGVLAECEVVIRSGDTVPQISLDVGCGAYRSTKYNVFRLIQCTSFYRPLTTLSSKWWT